MIKEDIEAAITSHPTPTVPDAPLASRKEKIDTIAHHFAKILEALDLDLSNPSLAGTPERVAEMYIDELFSGLDPAQFPEMQYQDNQFITPAEGMILVRDIPIKSMCEHHFVPFIGHARVAYLPQDKIIGLSKIHRIVDYFCRRPQLQERLTAQIADALSIVLGIEDVAVMLEAEHFCVSLRGIENSSSCTETTVLRGKFQQDSGLKAQFLRDC